jgi:predicted short-subunit dehydrogenase-like oxidoreductase (DUF2520 family)
MNRTVSLIGAGRVGKTLGKCLHRLGWRIEAVVARSDAHARAAVRWIGAGKPRGRITSDIFSASVILIAVPDTDIATVANRLARLGGTNCKGKIALHTSGALDHSVLAPLARRGASTGSLHPMQTFTGRETPKLKNVIFAIEGEPRARHVARRIARQLGGFPVTIDPKSKVAYHLAGTLVAGHGLALMEAATQILVKLGFRSRRAWQALLPLMRQMLDNFESVGPQRAWTGPLARRDYAIVAAHANALRRYPREFRLAYAALALLSARVLASDPAATIARLHRALNPQRAGSRLQSGERNL